MDECSIQKENLQNDEKQERKKGIEKMMISVIIPVYNARDTLSACVKSVQNQDYPNIQIFLVDDGSTDRSGELCEKLALQDQRIQVIHQVNGGPSRARNAGINAAVGEYLSFVDADDIVEPTYLSYLLSLIQTDPDCRICQANHWIQLKKRKNTNSPKEDGITVFSRKDAAEAVLFHDRIDVSAWGKLYHRSVFESLRFPEGKIFEDTWLFGKLLQQTGTYIYGGKPQYHYMLRDGSLTRSAYSSQNLEYIEAAEEMTNDILKITPGCKAGALRRVNHARLSVLRYMENCGKDALDIRESLRQQVLKDAPEYLRDQRTPKRDALAIKLLKMGFPIFYAGWSLYTQLRE